MIVSHSANEHGEMKGRHFKMQRNGSYLNSRMETQGHAGLLEEIGTIVNEFLRARREGMFWTATSIPLAYFCVSYVKVSFQNTG